MARNEEKQLARLNRYYLQQNKEEELRKRPPRPRLDSLTTLDEVKKWIPSIMKDIEFYVKQMEVSCYPKRTIEEFERRISKLRGEYKAFVKKAHDLEPELNATPWSDRPYNSKRQRRNGGELLETKEGEVDTKDTDSTTSVEFSPISTPLLFQTSSCPLFYGERHPDQLSDQNNPNTLLCGEDSIQDQPLHFQFGQRQTSDRFCSNSRPKQQPVSQTSITAVTNLQEASEDHCEGQSQVSTDLAGVNSLSNSDKDTSGNEVVGVSLNLPYSDSSSDNDDDVT